jgi:hypothetical protein
LGKLGGEAILSNLSAGIKYINLDNNQIGPEAMVNLVKWIDYQNTGCMLEELSLVGNNIDDSVCILLSESLSKHLPPIKDLNLSKNNIGDRGAIAIGEFL